jgi:hypothetical protein
MAVGAISNAMNKTAVKNNRFNEIMIMLTPLFGTKHNHFYQSLNYRTGKVGLLVH